MPLRGRASYPQECSPAIGRYAAPLLPMGKRFRSPGRCICVTGYYELLQLEHHRCNHCLSGSVVRRIVVDELRDTRSEFNPEDFILFQVRVNIDVCSVHLLFLVRYFNRFFSQRRDIPDPFYKWIFVILCPKTFYWHLFVYFFITFLRFNFVGKDIVTSSSKYN